MTPEEHAERALLGAILRDPRQIRDVSGMAGLRPEDFGADEHQALYRAMLKASEDNELRTVDDWNRFRAALIPAAAQAGRDRKWLRSLGISTPAPNRALRYSLIVMEGHNRRTIVSAARRIAAELATTATTAERLGRTQQEITAMRRVVEELATRWRQQNPNNPADEAPSSAPPSVVASAQPSNDLTEAAAARTRLSDRLPAWMRPEQRRIRAREEQLIATLVQAPEQLADLDWLNPADFISPHAAALYEAIKALNERDEPIDPIGVLAEAHRHHPIDSATADRFIATCARETPPAIILARDVIEQAISTSVHSLVNELADQVSLGSAATAVTAAGNTLTKIAADVTRYSRSREATDSDAHAYVLPDSGLIPSAPQQQIANASARP